jgi:predicted flap endonuclease-1-like 5' DNA nuclease
LGCRLGAGALGSTIDETAVLADCLASPVERPDDFRVISGVGKSTVEALHERGIYTFDQLMESELDFLPGKVRQAIEAYFGG